MNARIRRLLISTITAGSLLTLTACHHKAATPSASSGATSSAAAGAAPAGGTVSGSASAGTGSGGHQTSGTKKGSMANACGASNGS